MEHCLQGAQHNVDNCALQLLYHYLAALSYIYATSGSSGSSSLSARLCLCRWRLDTNITGIQS